MSAFPIDYIPSPDPFVEFDIWIKKVIASNEVEPTAAALATVRQDQRPACRMVLFRGVLHGSFTFFTNYESNKAKELEVNTFAALTFHWKKLELQVRVEGRVIKTSRSESEKYFASRERASQIGAWASSQSRTLSNRADLEARREEVEKKFEGKNVVCPPFWGGYRMVPDLFEFWVSEPGRLHNRFQYLVEGKSWSMNRLYP